MRGRFTSSRRAFLLGGAASAAMALAGPAFGDDGLLLGAFGAAGIIPYVGPVANNTIMATSVSAGPQIEQSTIHTVRCPGGISDLQVVFPGYYVNNTATYPVEQALASAYTVDSCAVEYPVNSGTWYNILKSGSSGAWTITLGINNYTDLTALGINIPDGANFRLYYHLTGTALPLFSSNNAYALQSDEGLKTASSITTTPKAVTDNSGTTRNSRVGAVAIHATRRGDSVAILGDSQQQYATSSYAIGDGVAADHNRGDIASTIGGTFAYTNLGIASDQWCTAFWSYANRLQLAKAATIVINGYGINDYNNKGYTVQTWPLLQAQRALYLFRGMKVICATITPRTTSASNTVANITATVSATTATVSAVSSGTILPGMVINSASGPRILAYGTNGTTGTGGTGTYALSVSSSGSATTATGSFVAADGSDQTLASYSTVIPTHNAGLTFSGMLASPLDRFATCQNATTANKWYADAGYSKRGTVDGIHFSDWMAHTHMAAVNSAAFVTQLQALKPVAMTQPTADLTGTPTFSGNKLTNGTLTRNDVLPGNAVFSLILNITLGASLSSSHNLLVNLQNSWAKSLTINTDGTVSLQVPSGSSISSTTALAFNGTTEVAVTCDGTTVYLHVNGVYQASIAHGGNTTTCPNLQMAASSSKNVSISEVTTWNRPLWTTSNHTPTTYAGTEAGLIVRYPLATAVTGIIGPGMPT